MPKTYRAASYRYQEAGPHHQDQPSPNQKAVSFVDFLHRVTNWFRRFGIYTGRSPMMVHASIASSLEELTATLGIEHTPLQKKRYGNSELIETVSSLT